MILKINALEIENFKGIKHAKIDLDGKNAIILGKNGIGKTTIADAFFWLMTDQDSVCQGKFNALELDRGGSVIDQQGATVTAELYVESKAVRLTKFFKQKWTKKRGAAKAEMTGHTTEYFFDRVPVPRKIYLDKLEELGAPDLLRMLADPHHFCGRLKPEQRREILLQIAGDVDPITVIAAIPGIEAALDGRTPEDAKAILLAARKKANEQLSALPERIDELRKMQPDVSGRDEPALRDTLKAVNDAISKAKNEILAVRSGLSIDESRKEAAQIEAEISRIEAVARREAEAVETDLYRDHTKIRREKNEIYGVMQRINDNIADLQTSIKACNTRRAELFEEWKKEQAEKFIPADTCFACGQPLPADQRAAQLETFNSAKADRLRKIDMAGNQVSDKLKILNASKERLAAEFMTASQRAEAADTAIKIQQAAIDEFQAGAKDRIAAKIAPLVAAKAESETKIKT